MIKFVKKTLVNFFVNILWNLVEIKIISVFIEAQDKGPSPVKTFFFLSEYNLNLMYFI